MCVCVIIWLCWLCAGSVRRSSASLIVSLCRHLPTPTILSHVLQTLRQYITTPSFNTPSSPSPSPSLSLASSELSSSSSENQTESKPTTNTSPSLPDSNNTIPSPYTLQGILYCYLHLFKLWKEFGIHHTSSHINIFFFSVESNCLMLISYLQRLVILEQWIFSYLTFPFSQIL